MRSWTCRCPLSSISNCLKHSEPTKEAPFGEGTVSETTPMCLAVFSKQGTAAPYMAASNLLAAMARMSGTVGQDADACGSYTQSYFYRDDTGGGYLRTSGPNNGTGNTHAPLSVSVRLSMAILKPALTGRSFAKKNCASAGFVPYKAGCAASRTRNERRASFSVRGRVHTCRS